MGKTRHRCLHSVTAHVLVAGRGDRPAGSVEAMRAARISRLYKSRADHRFAIDYAMMPPIIYNFVRHD